MSTQLPDLTRNSGLIAVLACFAAIASVWLLRPVWRWLCGPVFLYECHRLTRNRYTIVLRTIVAVLLLGGLAILMPEVNRSGPGDMAAFADRFSSLFLHFQAAVVFVVTPLYFGSALTEEKERNRFDFLVVSDLTSREIVLGKLAAQLVHIGGLLIAGLPVLAITQVWGGVDLLRVVIGYAAVLATLFSLGSFSLLCSALSQRSPTAVTCAYGFSLLISAACLCQPLWYLSSPFAFLAHVDSRLAEYDVASRDPLDAADATKAMLVELRNDVGAYTGFHGLLGIASLALAAAQVRRGSTRTQQELLLARIASAGEILPSNPAATPLALPPFDVAAHGWLPRIGHDPIAWKERFLGREGNTSFVLDMLWFYFYLIVAGIAVTGLFMLDSAMQDVVRSALGTALRCLFTGMLIVLIVGLGMRACTVISDERERRTLETLISLPPSLYAILTSKLKGVMLRRLRMFLALAVIIGVSVLTAAIPPLPGIVLVIVVFVHSIFAVCLGAFLSIVCRTTLRARMIWVAVMLVMVAASLIHTSRLGLTATTFDYAFAAGGNAASSAWYLSHPWDTLVERPLVLVGACIGLGSYAVTAAILWLAGWQWLKRSEACL